MDSQAVPVSVRGRRLDTAPHAFGELRRSDDAFDDTAELRRRLADDGYLFLPGCLDRAEVLRVRQRLLASLARLRATAPGVDYRAAVPPPRSGRILFPDVARQCASLTKLLYAGRMVKIYERIFGEQIQTFDFTWFRALPPGRGTKAHMDSVFMNRGSLELLTAWTPLGDIDRALGGLAILEHSHRHEQLRQSYGRRDVDTYCSNHEGADDAAAHEGLRWDGALADDATKLRDELGGRWLTADYRAGDLLTFTIFTIHCGLDNNACRLRLSCDARYLPASQPVDPRWVGADPSAHSARSKRGVIC